MKKIKCECGHVNPEGTVLCEACGKPIEGNQHIDGNDKKKLLNMRYDGTARRSQTYNKSIVDKIWSFFSSVKVGVWLIVIALVASAIGSIFPQEMYIPQNAVSRDPAIFYEERYGIFGLIFYQLGFHNLYSSWWYMILIALIGVSLVICSLDRFVPLFKALRKQRAKRHETFLSRQRLFSETETVSSEDWAALKEGLKKQRYKMTEEDGHLLAEKGRFSRWGPYVNHIGLIIILLAALLRTTPLFYMDEYVWIREGEQLVLPGTDQEYYIKNKDFIIDNHDPNDTRFKEAISKEGGEVPSNYQTDVIIYKAKQPEVTGAEPELEKIIEDDIRMNKPVKFDGYAVYQQGYQLNEFTSMSFKVHKTDDPDEKALGSFTIDLTSPKSEYKLENGFRVEINKYYPDYYLDDDGVPASETNYPRNPAFVMLVHPPNGEEPEISFLGIGKNIDATGENDYNVGITDFEMHDVSGLRIRRDYSLPYFMVGAVIFMIGVIQGMYWQHRRIWIRPKDGGILLAAHTNKNWHGVKKDIEKVIAGTKVKMVSDQQELDE
ncbi:MAG: cytochrome c biogenesis protein ResB [Bacillota bacterium]|uniref:cytochrome c biogenesis protein ResB n=1 Tax=Virgibacillus TaxID=84406 RepID=UPI0004257582|nr:MULTISPECIES: cytochrome c biogenesis protein ResB [Bacillaceae]MCC2249057.1 cytochrome c biogenesis protein ResB [Virgibacillus sp. AGTR]MDY7043417.1 cytochrome c biogenesis protein ResB [Virgibacillus sp. M23]QRZ16979.1 cytochrome c biogenesis protein ResB [Virgibacillus sp. AGTR]